MAGYECKSTWNRIKAYLFWDESANLSPNMDLHNSCDYLHNYPDELP